ncbi:MAG: hypothetical protein ACC656_15595, partial [Candidatus Heimdallarchaeota archaeon]
MINKYDFSLEVDYPKGAIDPLGDMIYQHGTKVWNFDGVSEPSITDEVEIMTTLFGIARLTEVNLRIAWQDYCRKEKLSEDDNPSRFKDVINLVDKYFTNEPIHWLYWNALSVADGMLHGDFYQAFIQSKKAYQRGDLPLTQNSFVFQRIALVKIGREGINFDSQTGVVTTSKGEEYPHKSFVPGKKKTIEDNFKSFYVSAAFV